MADRLSQAGDSISGRFFAGFEFEPWLVSSIIPNPMTKIHPKGSKIPELSSPNWQIMLDSA